MALASSLNAPLSFKARHAARRRDTEHHRYSGRECLGFFCIHALVAGQARLERARTLCPDRQLFALPAEFLSASTHRQFGFFRIGVVEGIVVCFKWTRRHVIHVEQRVVAGARCQQHGAQK